MFSHVPNKSTKSIIAPILALSAKSKEIEMLKMFFEKTNRVFIKVHIFNHVWDEVG